MLNRDRRTRINQAAHAAAVQYEATLRARWTADIEALQRSGAPFDDVEAALRELSAPPAP